MEERMLTSPQSVEGFRRLLEVHKDAQAWFRIMADECFDAPTFIELFTRVSSDQQAIATHLRARLRTLGDSGDSSVTAILARAWRDTSSLFGKDTRALSYRLESTLQFLERCCDDYRITLRAQWTADDRAWMEKQYAALRELQGLVGEFLSASAEQHNVKRQDDLARSN